MKTRKRFLSLCLCLSLLLGLMPVASLTVSATEETEETEQVAPVIADQYGDFMVAVTSGSASVSSTGAYLSLAYGGTYEISMADDVETTDMYIIVWGDSSSSTTITLNGVSISSFGSALRFATSDASGSNQTISLQLLGTNSLVSSEGAGIEKNVTYYNGEPQYGTGTLRISGTGSLTATGGDGNAGIGSYRGYDTMNIYIGGGTIVATGGALENHYSPAYSGAGIGGGGYSEDDGGIGGNAYNITISGGTVTAIGGNATVPNVLDDYTYTSYSGAGIGGGGYGDASNISIIGGTVTASGGRATAYSKKNYSISGAGIGGGGNGDGSNISISGGIVNAYGGYSSGDGNYFYGASIGGGAFGSGSSIFISGGTIKANNNISGGENGSTGTITITGGSINIGTGKMAAVDSSGNPLYCLTATLLYVDSTTGSTVNATDTYIMSMTGYSDYNIYSMYTDSSGNLYLWLPEGAEVTGFKATDGVYSNYYGVTMGTEAATGSFGHFLSYSIETEVIGYPGARLIVYSGNSPWNGSSWENDGSSSVSYTVIFDADETTDVDSSGSMNQIEPVPDGYTLVGLYLLEADENGEFADVDVSDLSALSISESFTQTSCKWTDADGVWYGGDTWKFTLPEANVKIVAVVKADDADGIAPTVTTSSLSSATLGTEYSEILTASGDAVTWTIASGSLPDGLSLDSSTGEISGTPTGMGTYTFTVKAANSTASDAQELTLSVVGTVTISTSGLSGAIAELSKYNVTGSDDTVTVTITPNDGCSFDAEPTVAATNATVGSLSESDGVYTCTVTGFTSNAAITVSGTASADQTMEIDALGGSIRITEPAGLRFGFSTAVDPDTIEEYGFYYIYDSVDTLTTDTENAKQLVATNWVTYNEGEEDQYTRFNLVFIDIPSSGYDTEITACAYIVVDGVTYYSEAVTRSFTQVANAVLADEDVDDDTKAAVQEMLDAE